MIRLILKSTTYFKSAFLSVKSLDFRWCTKHFMMTSIINLLCEKKKISSSYLTLILKLMSVYLQPGTSVLHCVNG